MPKFPPSIEKLIHHFSQLPGIGPKTAQRLVFHLITQPQETLDDFASSIKSLISDIIVCHECFNYALSDPCNICKDQLRDKTLLCVVSKPQDIITVEKIGIFKGLYHVLGGTLNPIEGITADKLKICELLQKIKKNNIREIILALNPDIEGETTTLYLVGQLKPFKTKISRLARGLPMGADLDYADDVTLMNAFNGRKEI